MSEANDHAKLVITVNTDHIAIATTMTYFAPKRSASHPPGTCMTV